MSTDSAVSIAWDVLKCLVARLRRGFRYVTSSESYANNLQTEVENLKYEAARIHHATEEAENNLRSIHVWVPEFLASAEKALIEAGDLLGKFEEASKTCCHGTLPEPNCRYQFSRKANYKTDDIKNLILEYSNREISFRVPTPGNVAALIPAGREGKDVVRPTTTAASASFVDLESRSLMIRNIMDALVDNCYSVVGVRGMGGIGKSTLLVDAEKRIREKNSFHWVAKADVSQNPDVKKIQEEIAHWLGLNDIKKEDNVSLRAKLLRERLEDLKRKKNKVLIILDNLWEQLDLKVVGIPCGLDNKVIGCKLLLTSRFRDVLREEMGCDRDFLLDELQEEEAKKLFERIVGDKVHVDKFKPLVAEALHKCAGLPFLIVNLAKRLKHAGLLEWKNALKQIGLSKNEGLGEMINNMLQSSYDHLKDAEKSLLALCVACGTSKPSLENLVRYSVGCGLFQEDNMEDARDSLRSLIRTLQASSFLLEDGDDYGFKIHDLVCEFVASVVSRDHLLLVLKDQDKSITELPKDKLKSCISICFPYIDMKKLPQELDCPELQIFLLFTNNQSIEVPDSLFNSMRKLMVLDLTGICLTCSPSSFQFLKNLHTLCLDNCSLDNVAILGELKGLQILSFVNSKIQRLPKEIAQLVELRLLDLNYCSKLQIIEPGVLRNLIKLEELYMKNSFNQWNVVEQTPPTNANMIELNDMKYLKTLHISIRNPSVLPEDLKVDKLTKYQMENEMGVVFWWSEESRKLMLEWDPIGEILQKGCIQSILGKTNDLILDGLNGIEKSICALSQKGFPELKHLCVKTSPSIHYILQSPSHTDFKTLESLVLRNLTNLEKICTNNISSESFSALKVVRVEHCHKMEVLFPLSLVRELPQLKEIEVVDCKLMQGIVEADESGKFEMCNLHVLKLHSLQHINNFFTAKSAPLSSTSDNPVDTQIAFFNGQQVAFQRLETLEIIGLDSLEFIFFPFMVKSLMQLKKLTILDCEKMEAIIMEEEGLEMETSEILAFSMLTDLRLERLKSLMYFSRGKCVQESRSQDRVKSRATSLFNPKVAFPNLENLYIEGMDNIKMIWHDPIHADSFSKLKLLSVSECKKLVNVVPSFILGRLLSLETLVAKGCDSLEVVFKLQPLNPLNGNSVVQSPLKELMLDDLSMLNCVWDNELYRHIEFQCLRSVTLQRCARLTSLFLTSIAIDLIQLEKLQINQHGIVELIEKEGLSELSIDVEAIEGPSHELKVASSFPSYFQHVKTLDVSLCDGLSNMFTSTIAENLVGLTKLRISKCEILTEVISDEGGKEGHVVTFNQLKYMELDGLTRLRCFSSNGYTLMFPLLEDIIVNRCPQMKFFHKGQIEVPKLKGVKVGLNKGYEATKCLNFWKGNLNMTIQNMFEEMATFAGTKYMQLFEFPELIGKWHGKLNPITSSWQLESLVVEKCPSFINVIPSSLMLVLKRMTSLEVRDCEPLDEIFDLEGLEAMDCTQVLPRLQYLHLVNLPKLRQLWNRDLQGTTCFNSLQHLSLYKCSNLRHAFIPSMARCLPNLWQIEIKECDQMEGVIVDEEGQGSAREEITFPYLDIITLECLPNLTNFLSWKNHMLECPNLSILSIAHCPKMRSLTWQSSMEINNGTPSLFTPQVAFQRLETLEINGLDNIGFIFFPSMVESLTQLKKLIVSDCEKTEAIIKEEEGFGTEASEILAFPMLTDLCLAQLKSLTCFSHGARESRNQDRVISRTTVLFSQEVAFKRLETLEISGLDNIGFIFFPSMVESLTQLKKLTVSDCEKTKAIIMEEEGFGMEASEILVFPMLTDLRLERLKSLTCFSHGKCAQESQNEDRIISRTTVLFSQEVAFKRLETLEISGLDNIRFIFFPSMVDSLTQLKKLIVSDCEKTKAIIMEEEGFGMEASKILVFPMVTDLRLEQLKSLMCFSRGKCARESRNQDCVKSHTNVLFSQEVAFKRLETLEISGLANIGFIFFPSMVESFTQLKKLTISDCERTEAIIMEEEGLRMETSEILAFPMLTDLHLERLKNFTCFACGKCARESRNQDRVKSHTIVLFNQEVAFKRLETLEISGLDNIRFIFFPSMVESLTQLKKLTISDCEKIEAIIMEEEGLGMESSEILAFRMLTHLHLERLKSLTCFSCGKCARESQNQDRVCSRTTVLFSQEDSRYIRHLQTLDVSHCDGLSNMFTPTIAKNLVALTKLRISNCRILTEVISDEEGGEGCVVAFNQLKHMELDGLIGLRSFN